MADDPVVLSGDGLTIPDLVRVARHQAAIVLAAGVHERMAEAWAVAEEAAARGDEVYGLTSGVGALIDRRPPTGAADRSRFNDVLISQHRVGAGPRLSDDLVRATLVVLVNGFARGFSTLRPGTVERLVAVVPRDPLPAVRSRGSVGQGDLAPLADLAAGALDGVDLVGGEALALMGSNAVSTATAALAVSDAGLALSWAQAAAALSMEGMRANVSVLDPVISSARSTVGLRSARTELVELLQGSGLWRPGPSERAPRLQDPLTFRTVPQLHGAALDALAHVAAVVEAEINAAHGNPLVDRRNRRLVSAGSFDASALVLAVDTARLALAMVLTAAAERSVKLLQAQVTGLRQGLAAPEANEAEDGLGELGVSVQAFASEARLLAQPVSQELVSTSQAAGIEDRSTLAALGARRLAEQVELARLVLATELVVAAQAVDLRPGAVIGQGSAAIHAAVRAVVPTLRAGAPVPDLEPLAARLTRAVSE